MSKKIMDGCEAATWAAYSLSDVATIYPISPIAEMGQIAQLWGLKGLKNLMGQALTVKEMESELGAAGATHGALAAGALATTFTNSQGLLLMIPNMYKIAGERLPGVFHVGTRSTASHALSIFSDHQDVMATRATGFAMLSSNSVQEAMDLGIIAHLSAIDGSMPVLHFFDGWRTSAQMDTIEVVPFSTIATLVDNDKINAFRRSAMNPEHPDVRGTAQNPNVFFQNREAPNKFYNVFPTIVQSAMDRFAAATGRQYHLFDYYGDPEATDIIVAMGTSCEVVEETIDYLASTGDTRKLGLICVRLYRPWDADKFLDVLPSTTRRIAVLDRTKEPGSLGEPLYLDVAATVQNSGRDIKIIGGRYGLGSKEFNPAMVKAVYDHLSSPNPMRQFTVGINDDVTHLSLEVKPLHIPEPGMLQSVFYGIGHDGTVGSVKQLAQVLSDTCGFNTQAYFQYSAKKSGGYTISQLRTSTNAIKAEYGIEQADVVVCNKPTYINKFELIDNLEPGGIFLLNTSATQANIDTSLPANLKRAIAAKKARFYVLDAVKIAQANSLGMRVNMIMATAYLHLLGERIDFDKAFAELKSIISNTYMHEGGVVVQNNLNAVEQAVPALSEITYDPGAWSVAADKPKPAVGNIPQFVEQVAQVCDELKGDTIPVSLMNPSGVTPTGTTAYEKRRIAINVPQWNVDNCVECTECSFVCPHAAIRPFLLTPEEKAKAPAGYATKEGHGAPQLHQYQYRIQVYAEDCTGCGSCAVICPGKALDMKPIASQLDAQIEMLDFTQKNVSSKAGVMDRFTINGSQFYTPLLQFSGACAGCGETPYVKLVTQLFGERMIIANATGCSSIWGADFPSTAYCVNPEGKGPAWGNSLFEDNAEYGYGIAVAVEQRRARLLDAAKSIVADPSMSSSPLLKPLNNWIAAYDDPSSSAQTGSALIDQIKQTKPADKRFDILTQGADMLAAKSVWAIGGDGWAYDIGFAGLDHVLATNQNINILVLDTECYSNTGGQTSKATPHSAMAKYSPDGKRTFKKDLGRMMMTYPNVYVAQIALGANYQQAIDALKEAEAHQGPSIVIAYCPCIEHGIRTGMSHTIVEEKLAVQSGYWQLYRYNPALQAQGKNPLTVDSATPDGTLLAYINNEDRYADLKMTDPNEAQILQNQLKQRCDDLYNLIVELSKQE